MINTYSCDYWIKDKQGYFLVESNSLKLARLKCLKEIKRKYQTKPSFMLCEQIRGHIGICEKPIMGIE